MGEKIRHREVIRYLDLMGLTPKQVHQNMEATVGEDILSNSMVKKWAGRFERGRESLEDDPVQKDCTMPDFVHFFSFSRSRRLETANWLCLIICSRKTRMVIALSLHICIN